MVASWSTQLLQERGALGALKEQESRDQLQPVQHSSSHLRLKEDEEEDGDGKRGKARAIDKRQSRTIKDFF